MLDGKSVVRSEKILVIDDNPADLDLISSFLRKTGYELFLSQSGTQALNLLEQNESIGIVLLDILMNDMDGFEVCKEIRKRFKDRVLQIIIISGSDSREEVSHAIELGADDFIRKPYTKLELQSRIKASWIRMQKQMGLFQEREYYRKAVKKEEEISSQVIDQNLSLKKAFNCMSNQKKSLELKNKNLKEKANVDMLSGLLNRSGLFSLLDFYIKKSIENDISLSGIMLDIDNFKQVNDKYGHLLGDEVIRSVGRLLGKALRSTDFAGRYGGEEFFIILANTQLNDAIMIADRFRKKIAHSQCNYAEKIVQVTVSLGVAEFKKNMTREEWIAVADKAMYLSKKKGKNCVSSIPLETTFNE